MKKVLVMLLAAAMMLAVVPFAFAEGGEVVERIPCEVCLAAMEDVVGLDWCCNEGCIYNGCVDCDCVTCGEAEEEPVDPYACIPACLRPLFDFLAPYVGEKIADLLYSVILKMGFKVLVGAFGF